MHTENDDCAVGEILRLASLAQDDTSSAPVCRRAMLGATGHLLLKEKAKGRGRLLADDQWSSLRGCGGGALQAEGEDGAAFRAVRGFDLCAHRFGGLFGDGKSNAVQAVLTFIE